MTLSNNLNQPRLARGLGVEPAVVRFPFQIPIVGALRYNPDANAREIIAEIRQRNIENDQAYRNQHIDEPENIPPEMTIYQYEQIAPFYEGLQRQMAYDGRMFAREWYDSYRMFNIEYGYFANNVGVPLPRDIPENMTLEDYDVYRRNMNNQHWLFFTSTFNCIKLIL